MLWYYAKGKPKDVIDLHRRFYVDDVEHMSDAELKAQLDALLAKL